MSQRYLNRHCDIRIQINSLTKGTEKFPTNCRPDSFLANVTVIFEQTIFKENTQKITWCHRLSSQTCLHVTQTDPIYEMNKY